MSDGRETLRGKRQSPVNFHTKASGSNLLGDFRFFKVPHWLSLEKSPPGLNAFTNELPHHCQHRGTCLMANIVMHYSVQVRKQQTKQKKVQKKNTIRHRQIQSMNKTLAERNREAFLCGRLRNCGRQ